MGKERIFLWLLILGALIISGCSPILGINQSALKDSSWQLVSFGSNIPLAGSDMTANFSSDEIQGNASCNHYFGEYKISGDQISISGLGWTEMACLDPEGIMEQEQILMGLLSRAAKFTLQGNNLQIITSTGEVLEFERSITGK
jgi:heat shock protein HslJ